MKTIVLLPLFLSVGCLEPTKLGHMPLCDSGLSTELESVEASSESKQLLSVDTTDGQVYQIDPQNGSTHPIASVSMEYQISTMDVNENGVAYVYDHTSQKIGIFDPCTGELELLPESNEDHVICGISFANNGTLYAIDSKNDLLVKYNLNTGEAIPIGALEMNIGACGLAYDSDADILIGATASTNEIFHINIYTGTTSNHITTDAPFEGVGIEYDEATDTLLASTSDELYSIEPNNGTSVFLGPLEGHIDDLVYHPECQ